MTVTHKHLVCPVCSGICNEVVATVNETGNVTAVDNVCDLGAEWFLAPALPPAAKVNGKSIKLEKALDHIFHQLKSSRRPLITGLTGLTVEAQQAAVQLARLTRAVIDIRFSDHHHGPIAALQKHGKVTSTLGELTRYATIICWFADPTTTHPDFFKRFAPNASNVFVVSPEPPADPSAKWIEIQHEQLFEILIALEQAAKQRSDLASTIAEQTIWHPLQSAIEDSSHVAMLYGSLESPESVACGINSEALFSLVRTLNQDRTTIALPVGNEGNSGGAIQVMSWTTGYPFGVDFASGAAQFNGPEFSAREIVERKECDSVLICSDQESSEPAALSCLDAMGDLPISMLCETDSIDCVPLKGNDSLQVQVARPGVSCGGDWFRTDGVCLPLKQIIPTELPTAEHILRTLCDKFSTEATD